MNFNFADDGALESVLPIAVQRGLAVITREVFHKGRLFAMGEEVGIGDRDLLSRAALKWNLSVGEVTTSLIGADDVAQLKNSLSVVTDPGLSDEEQEVLQILCAAPTYIEYAGERRARFAG